MSTTYEPKPEAAKATTKTTLEVDAFKILSGDGWWRVKLGPGCKLAVGFATNHND